jgi:molecular chaperone HtpG
MSDTSKDSSQGEIQSIPFKAETRQLLDILIHSLYTDREIFLRELISNASDALTQIDFLLLTNRNVNSPEAELSIRIASDPKENTITISDTGVGMTSDELVENLGTIAHSGARAFVEAAKKSGKDLANMIGQFGVGFYSAFMVADWIKVVSRSYKPDAQAAVWYSTGNDTFTVEQAERAERGTSVIVKLKSEASEFLQESRLKEIIRKHSDFIPFPIYIGEEKEQINRQTTLWRQNPRQVEEKEYHEFYKQLTLDFEPPLIYTHMVVDAPAQMYAILYVPSKFERALFSLRREDGLKLYARKVLIQEYCKDLQPEYFRFVQGVVDSEDLPLNVSRESIQSNKVMLQLKKLITSKVIDTLKKLSEEKPEAYEKFWNEFGRYVKEGVAIEQSEPEVLYPLLRFHTTQHTDQWCSLDDYVKRMKPDQKEIYYIMGDNERSVVYSPHLDIVRQKVIEVLMLTDPVDAFMLVRLNKFQDRQLVNIARADLSMPEEEKKKQLDEGCATTPEPDLTVLVDRFKKQLAERVSDVRITNRLSESPSRLVDPQGAPTQELQRVYRLLKEDFQAPKKVLELNPRHTILVRLSSLPADDPLVVLIIEQVYEDALLIEGLHPDPVGMIPRIQKLMEAALKS